MKRREKLQRAWRSILAIAGAVTASFWLAGCRDGAGGDVMGFTAYPLRAEERHPVEFSRERVALEIEWPKGVDRLSRSQRAAVDRFFMAYRNEGVGPIRMASPPSRYLRAGERDFLHHIEARAGVTGVGTDKIVRIAQRYGGDEGHRRVSLDYPVAVARGAPCGHWPRNLAYDKLNQNYFNLGCAIENNIAVSAANPRDLMGPSGSDPRAGERRDIKWRDYTGQASAASGGGSAGGEAGAGGDSGSASQGQAPDDGRSGG